jgi:lactate permease
MEQSLSEERFMWHQIYDPLGNPFLSTVLAALPVVVLLGAIGIFRIKAHWAALLGLAAALIIAIFVFGMPGVMAGKTAVLGMLTGLLPIGWIILNVIFLYKLSEATGRFKILQDSIAGITNDRRLQLLLVAFAFGAFFEGASGFGTPVAVTGAILIGLGFSPLAASALSLIANTAPVAYGALGTPIIGLQSVTGLDLNTLSAMVGRQLPFFSILVPFWLIWAFAGFKRMLEIWPAILITAVAFAVPQFLMSNYHGPTLVDVVASLVSMACLAGFLKVWRPKTIMLGTTRDSEFVSPQEADARMVRHTHSSAEVLSAWLPWIILCVVVFAWGLPSVKTWLNGISNPQFPIEGLHNMIQRVPPVAPPNAKPEGAVYALSWLSATGSGILLASIIAGLVMKVGIGGLVQTYWRTLVTVRFSLLTIAAMLAIGVTTRYSGLDATMGLAFAKTGVLYPFFGTLLGWLGVALTGSDTASNVLFGSLQKITSEQLGLNPVLMAAANSSGGVMGKMIDAQSIVVAATATNWYGHESEILRYVFFHSLALACLVGLLVMAQAYVYPFTSMVLH